MFVTMMDATDGLGLVGELSETFAQLAAAAYTDAENIRATAGMVLIPSENASLLRRAAELEGQGQAYSKAAYMVHATHINALRQLQNSVRGDIVEVNAHAR